MEGLEKRSRGMAEEERSNSMSIICSVTLMIPAFGVQDIYGRT